uniref:Uncharacterized protein n=1 Tax=Solanum tuberosum TaxID=4113 RepID=M1BDR7_SOLTU
MARKLCLKFTDATTQSNAIATSTMFGHMNMSSNSQKCTDKKTRLQQQHTQYNSTNEVSRG